MTDDAVGILDEYQIKQAHLVGMSLGGMIAQVAVWLPAFSRDRESFHLLECRWNLFFSLLKKDPHKFRSLLSQYAR